MVVVVAGGARCSLQELRKLWLRKAEYSETTRILDEMYAPSHHTMRANSTAGLL